jgi:hypothetical protein
MLLLLPPSSPPGQYQCYLLSNMAQGRIQFLRAHRLLTQVLINIGNSASNHIIDIRQASRLVLLLLVCNDLLFICWPRRRSRNRLQNLRVRHPSVPYHIAILHRPWRFSCQITPTILLNGVSTKVDESLHNISLSRGILNLNFTRQFKKKKQNIIC